jgi:hypothetical protein
MAPGLPMSLVAGTRLGPYEVLGPMVPGAWAKSIEPETPAGSRSRHQDSCGYRFLAAFTTAVTMISFFSFSEISGTSIPN